MYRILLIEDSISYQLIVKHSLSDLEINLTSASSLAEGMKALKESKYLPDLIILDLSLPDGEGFSVLEYLKSQQLEQETAVILLTGKNDLSVKVAAFDLGAEDYLVKPISPVELRARVEMRLRKKLGRKKDVSECKRGPLTLDPSLMRVRLQKENQEVEVELTSKEFKILYCIAREDQRTFSRADLVKEVWGSKVHVLERTVDSHICGIRRKLGEVFIECVPGVGYRFLYPEKKKAQSKSTISTHAENHA